MLLCARGVRTALRLGYKVVPYESAGPCSKSGDECQDERERGQAQNLVDRIWRADPTAKVLVHVGRTHAAKLKLEGHYAFMAWHLQQISGSEPFTIDQTALSERKNPLDETSHYRLISSQVKPGKPTVFQDAKGNWFSPRGGYDMAVYHPRAEYQHGRPTWLKMGDARHAIEILWKKLHLDPAKLNQEIVVQAFIAAEANDAVPIDQVLVKPGRPPFVLMLPNSAVRIRAVTASGEVLGISSQ